jgi:hypothetical protein
MQGKMPEFRYGKSAGPTMVEPFTFHPPVPSLPAASCCHSQRPALGSEPGVFRFNDALPPSRKCVPPGETVQWSS